MIQTQTILSILEAIAPQHFTADWDNTGLLVGSMQSRVDSILLALDPTAALISEAQALNANLIITHHPAIFQPLKRLRTDQPSGQFLAAALRADISVIGCHTNFDATDGGVSDVLAQTVGLTDVSPLLPQEQGSCCGIGRIGVLPETLTSEDFLARLLQAAEFPWLLEAGPRPAAVNKAAVCGGSCADLAETALAAGADVFLTSEIKHHVARWAEEAGLWLLDGGHFATENPAMRRLSLLLADQARQAGLTLPPVHLARQKAPLRLAQPFFSQIA
jgi:dinuclear metal center YbgI/SA1388 family protein